MQNTIQIPSGLLAGASTGFQQDILSFLQKPLILANGTMSSSDNSGTFAPIALLQSFFSNDIYKSKVKGYMAIRATIVLKIQFNADRFMQGRYIMGFLPLMCAGYANFQSRVNQAMATKTQVTQLPQVQFDLNSDTEAVLEIPYVSPYTHFHLNDSTGDVGSVILYPYIPITTGTGGSNTCQYTMWMSLKDIELVTPTLPQSNIDFSDFEFQMAGPRTKGSVKKKSGRNVAEVEQDSMDVGPLTGMLTKVAKAADIIGKVPMLSAIAAPASWALQLAAGAAGVFGWSKPVNLGKIDRSQLIDYAYMNNCDAVDNSMLLSATSQNSVEAMPGFAGTDTDEMSIDYIKTIPAYITNGSWSLSGYPPGTILLSGGIGPRAWQPPNQSDAASAYQNLTPVHFLASLFRNYRGSIRMTFKFAKTEFHSGRLLFIYVPRGQEAKTAPTLMTSNYCHREIIDLRMGSEFSFVVPFASTQAYYPVATQYGSFNMMVLNQLTAPSSVNPTIQFVVEMCGAPDLEFSVPHAVNMAPYVPLTIQSSIDFSDFEFQMDNTNSIVDTMVGGASLFDDHNVAARFCVGEKIMSLSQLMKRSFDMNYNGNLSTATDFAINPWVISSSQGYNTSGTTYVILRTLEYSDMYSIINSCYALSRGGIRIKVVNNNYNTNNIKANLETMVTSGSVSTGSMVNTSPSTGLVVSGRITTGSLGVIQNGVSKQGLEIQVPMYHRFPSRVNFELVACGGPPGLNYNPNVTTMPDFLVWVNQTTTGTNLNFLRSVSDDFQCGYFIGIPPMLGAFTT